ncbi:hypothetical protein [Arsenicicoccus dermatophilus]|uniref:hypothetical protein n=1 Tax=Arsenicicoccus dermatophilus TaxID=1076331 RepID=UPI001F4CCBA3|nr:hypothetical protein [Arsenicicoccus dermatophilus]MCH8614396.1 hypothetical protein [Arsenicicoccus dermatophilus]
MSDVTWTDVVSALASTASVVATVGVALVVGRLDRAQQRREKAETIRLTHLSWSSQMDALIDERFGVQDQGAQAEPAVVTPLKAQGVDTRMIQAQADVLRGHLALLDLDPRGQGAWAQALNEQPNPDEAIEMAVNGSLDVVKDYVLRDTLDPDGDYDWLDDEFFQALEQPRLVASGKTGGAGARSDELIDKGMQRWVKQGAPRDVRVRVEALLRYKIHLEGMLRVFFFGEFSNGDGITQASYSKKYLHTIRSLARTVKDEVDRQAESAMMTFLDHAPTR